MYSVRPRPLMPYGRRISPGELEWKRKWPFLVSSIIAVTLIVFSLIIFALEIASLARSTEKVTFDGNTLGNTASTGAGIWCGFFFLAAGLLILAISKANTLLKRYKLIDSME